MDDYFQQQYQLGGFVEMSMNDTFAPPTPELPRASIIVPMFNPGEQFYRLLDALYKQDYPNDRFEILLVDDGSSEFPNKELANSLPSISIYTQKNKGSYAARNLGISHSKGEIIAFTDVDCIPESDWLRQGVYQLLQNDADLIAGEILFDTADPDSVIELYDINFHLRQKYYVEHHNFGATANLFIKRSLFDRVGGFDDTRRSGGDYHFCTRAVRQGAWLKYGPQAVIRHPTRRSFTSLLRKRIRIARGFWNLIPDIRHKLAYLLPIPLSRYPQAGHQVTLSSLPFLTQIRFVLLHYLIESIRCLFCAFFLINDAVHSLNITKTLLIKKA